MDTKTRWIVLAAVLVACLICPGTRAAEKGYETPPVLEAKKELPAEARAGEHFTVNSDVQNDGMMNHYVVDSDYGPFEAYGNLSLAVLIHQIHALTELDEVSKSKEFVEAVGRSATGQLKTVKEFGQHPVSTVKGIPGGVKSLFHKYKRAAKKGYSTAKQVGHEVGDTVTPGDDDGEKGDEDGEKDDAEGEKGDEDESSTDKLKGQTTEAAKTYANKWFGTTAAERMWYKKLGVDPYNRNTVLQHEVKSMSHVDAAAHVGMKFVPIPSIPGVSQVQKVQDAVWDVDPAELREQNTKRLQEAGVDEKLIQRFMGNDKLSPSQQTLTLVTLGKMKGVEGLESVLELSARSESREEAEFALANTLFLQAYHKLKVPLTRLYPGEPVPVAMTSGNGLIILVSVDHAFWTEDLGEVITIMSGKFAGQEADTREIQIRGRASSRFVAEVADLGWTVRQSIGLTEKIEEKFLHPDQAGQKPEGKDEKGEDKDEQGEEQDGQEQKN